MRDLRFSRIFGFSIIAFLALSVLPGCRDQSEDTADNSPPTIAGKPPPAVLVGNTYEFQPEASDADGDALSFDIQSKPDWLQFDRGSGRLHGKSSAGNEGVYEDIQISVSDGKNETTLSPFSIAVVQTAPGSVTLSWTPPVENTDGSVLSTLAGYRIYYGLSAGSYPNKLVIDNPGLTSYVVENLVPNIYYFVATSVNSDGLESSYSNVMTYTIDPE